MFTLLTFLSRKIIDDTHPSRHFSQRDLFDDNLLDSETTESNSTADLPTEDEITKALYKKYAV